MAKHKVLSTKKLEPSLIEQANENDIEIIEQEAIKIYPIRTKEKWNEIFQIIEAEKEFVVFTSSNAVNGVKKYLNDYTNPFEIKWKIFSLSGRSKDALDETAGALGRIIGTADNAAELAEKIISQKPGEVIFFCGNQRRNELPDRLKAAGIKVHEVAVYETVATPVAAAEDLEAILFFSPSAVQSFFSINQLKKNTVCFAIGQTTANSILDFTSNKIIITESPKQEMMLESVRFYFENSSCNE